MAQIYIDDLTLTEGERIKEHQGITRRKQDFILAISARSFDVISSKNKGHFLPPLYFAYILLMNLIETCEMLTIYKKVSVSRDMSNVKFF